MVKFLKKLIAVVAVASMNINAANTPNSSGNPIGSSDSKIWNHKISLGQEKPVDQKLDSTSNFIRYQLRRYQTLKSVNTNKDSTVTIFAPLWVKDQLEILHERIKHIEELHLEGDQGRWSVFRSNANDKFELPKEMTTSLYNLQLLSRNERFNVDGIIRTELYSPGIKDISVIISLRDLVRQTVIIGKASTTGYGGYRSRTVTQISNVYICDLAALQFQTNYNSGRLVLIHEKEPKASVCGLPEIDKKIYENVVGERKLSFTEAKKDSRRYKEVNSRVFGKVLFDTVAYKKFVAADVLLTGLGLEKVVGGSKSEKINFKFLKYGSGFFAGEFGQIIEQFILDGVLEGIQILFEKHHPKYIKNIELPFYVKTEKCSELLQNLESKHNIKIVFSHEDALKSTYPHLVTATTNCADPHAVFGNEMGHQSVDASIAENLVGKGDQFCPLINTHMKSEFINFDSFCNSKI